jgi:hypothetical protein
VSLFKPGKPVLPPGTRGGRQRLSIDGWRVTYYEPTYGTRTETVKYHHELAKMKRWLDEGGYSYKVREIR